MDKENEEKILDMMNGFIDFWNGMYGSKIQKFESCEEIEKYIEENKSKNCETMDVHNLAEMLDEEKATDIQEFVELFGKSKEEIEEKINKVDKMYKETLEKELKNIQEKAEAGDLNAKMTLKFQVVYQKIIAFMDKTVEKGNIQHVIDVFNVIEGILDNELGQND